MFSAIKRFFSSAIRRLWSVLKSIISSALEEFLAALMDFAKDVVTKLEASDFDNDDRRREAFDMIKAEALKRGMIFKSSWIFFLIEIALRIIKKELGLE